MKKLFTVIAIAFITTTSFSQSGKVKKTAKKMDVFLNVDSVSTITVIDQTNSGLEANINRYLIKYGFDVLSKRTAEQRLAQIQYNRNTTNINGAQTTLNSELVILITSVGGTMYEILNANFQIIDLTKQGKVIGGANYTATIGGRKPAILAEALVYGIKKQLE
jgi:hypothetical protein|tara:strand:+ start:172 stop:660 length:489 start_codon:yes stop_codon:yes gene_type:complete